MPWPAPPPKFPSSPTSTSFQTWGGKRLRVRAGKQPTIKRTSNQCVSDKLLPVSFDLFWFRQLSSIGRFIHSGWKSFCSSGFPEVGNIRKGSRGNLRRSKKWNLWLNNSLLCSLLMFSQCSLWPVVLYCCLLIFPLAFDSFYWDITCTIAQPLEG